MAGLFDDLNPIKRIASNQYGVSTGSITKGSLISFNYNQSYALDKNVIHDPYPMVIITDVWPKHIRGLNLHYLTFPYVKRILEVWGGNPSFGYSNIKPDRYIANAFRMYSRMGVRSAKRLDSEWLKTVLQSVRSFAPGEIEKIRANIQQQIQQRLQTKAKELASYELWKNNLNNQQLFNNTKYVNNALSGNNFNQPSANLKNQLPDEIDNNL